MTHTGPDNWNAGTGFVGYGHSLEDARRDLEWQQAKAKFSNDMSNAPADAVRGAVGDMVTIGLVGAGVGIGMAKNKKFRYGVQAFLHLPMAFVVALMTIFMLNPGEAELSFLWWAIVISIVWTGLYVALRTVPKWRRLNREQYEESLPQPPPPPRFAAGNNPY